MMPAEITRLDTIDNVVAVSKPCIKLFINHAELSIRAYMPTVARNILELMRKITISTAETVKSLTICTGCMVLKIMLCLILLRILSNGM